MREESIQSNVIVTDNNKESKSKLLRLARMFNNFYFDGKKIRKKCLNCLIHIFLISGYRSNDYKPLFCQGHHIGLVSRQVETELIPYQDIFVIHPGKIDLCPGLTSHKDISAQVESVLVSLKEKNIFSALKGWRNETYDIRPTFGQPPLFAMERAATCLFGLRQYGVDVNG